MRKKNIAVVLFVTFLWACGSGFFTTPIGSILKNPRDYEGKLVKVSGVVTENMNIFVMKGFKLKDDTGEIFVITNKILPKAGSTATAKGYIKEGFTIGDAQFIVIIEGEEKP